MLWRSFQVAILAMVWANAAVTQSSDRGRLQAFLEDSLSDAGRDVRIDGFRGALSGQSSFDSITIADDEGVWLTIKGGVLDWNRAQVLRGNLQITELSAREILLPRLPRAGGSAPTPEASPFSLPD